MNTRMERLHKFYRLYLSAYRKEIRRQQERLDVHLRAKFTRENVLIHRFLASPTEANWYQVANGIYGPNEGNRYPEVRKILEQGEKVLHELVGY